MNDLRGLVVLSCIQAWNTFLILSWSFLEQLLLRIFLVAAIFVLAWRSSPGRIFFVRTYILNLFVHTFFGPRSWRCPGSCPGRIFPGAFLVKCSWLFPGWFIPGQKKDQAGRPGQFYSAAAFTLRCILGLVRPGGSL